MLAWWGLVLTGGGGGVKKIFLNNNLFSQFCGKCLENIDNFYLALSSSSHSFPPFLLENMQLAALLQLQDCIRHWGPIR